MLCAVSIRRALLGAAMAASCLAGALAQDDILFERDTPYVPTPQDVVERMLDLSQVKAGEVLIDLGSGDGRIAVTAAQRGARAYGVDINPERVKEANANAATAGVTGRATFEVKDLFDTDISRADVVMTYLLPLVNLDLRPRILEQMKPGARLVTHAFHMGDWWPDVTDSIRHRVLFYWVIPAKLHGRWQVKSEYGDFDLDMEQSYQAFNATVYVHRRLLPEIVEAHTTRLHEGRLNGTEIRFVLDIGSGPRVFRGRVDGDSIVGILPQGWSAKRITK